MKKKEYKNTIVMNKNMKDEEVTRISGKRESIYEVYMVGNENEGLFLENLKIRKRQK